MLVVTREKRQLKKVAINKDVFIIGRSSQCDLPLESEGMASRQHSEITREGGVYWVRDCGSRNGTLLNGKSLAERTPLKDGDEIEVGASRIKFVLDRADAEGDEPPSGATRVMDVPKAERGGGGKKVRVQTGRQDWRVTLSITEGPFAGAEVSDWESPLLIGRGLDNHIVLLDDAASIHHARIVSEGDRHVLEDLDSSNGTFVDGLKARRTTLQDGHKIKIGLSTLLFKKCNVRKQRQMRIRILLAAVGVVVLLGAIKLLQPRDVAGQYVADAQALAVRGEWGKAMENYQAALKSDPGRVEAKAGLRAARLEQAAQKTLAEADAAAGKENYERAKELCYQVLRDLPNHAQARGLEAVIKSIENAKIAITARNWSDAVSLLEKARETFPKSVLVGQRLADAEKELAAERSLAKANECLQHQQGEMAEECLRAIPESSVYFIEAKEKLDGIAVNRKMGEYLNRAKADYQKGCVAEALAELDAGLQKTPAQPQLLGLRDRVRLVEPLVAPLHDAEASELPPDVEQLSRRLQACEILLQAEDDPLNTLRKRAVGAKQRLIGRLGELSREHALAAGSAAQAGNRKEAMRLYKLAVRADPDNTPAAEAMGALQKKMTVAARSAYQRGIVHEELGQADLARESFKAVLELSAPDEDYYTRAAKKLKDYAQ